MDWRHVDGIVRRDRIWNPLLELEIIGSVTPLLGKNGNLD